MNKKIETIKFILADFISGGIVWAVFFIYRKVVIESTVYGHQIPVIFDKNFYLGLFLIPLYWLILYASIGYYDNVLRKSRLKDFGQTLFISIIGVTVMFFLLILDDKIVTYKTYYSSFISLLSMQFGVSYFFRFFLTSSITKKVHTRKIGFNTLIIGSNQKAVDLFLEMEAQKKSGGNKFVGFVNVASSHESMLLNMHLTHLGNHKKILSLIKELKIEEVIIAIETHEREKLNKILNELYDCDIIIKIIPDMYDILSGTVKLSSIWSSPLLVISPELMPPWQQNFKRVFDIFVSLFGMILLLPFYTIIAISVKLTSKGPIFYKQDRIGKHGKSFTLFKFRSMYINAENGTPKLSKTDDPRITSIGLFIRKTRLDEIPQFYNILIGDMSFVGYRPERKYFIDKICETAPHYKHLLKIKPGMTSWGQVKYGYAENIDQMVERLKYDIMYLENMSLALDFKILINTVIIVLQGRGK